MKHFTFKTVFLLALEESGKCRSEIHAWGNKKVRHQSDWSKFPLEKPPISALHYYLVKTHDLRDGKELVVVFFKKNFNKDISPTICIHRILPVDTLV